MQQYVRNHSGIKSEEKSLGKLIYADSSPKTQNSNKEMVPTIIIPYIDMIYYKGDEI